MPVRQSTSIATKPPTPQKPHPSHHKHPQTTNLPPPLTRTRLPTPMPTMMPMMVMMMMALVRRRRAARIISARRRSQSTRPRPILRLLLILLLLLVLLMSVFQRVGTNCTSYGADGCGDHAAAEFVREEAACSATDEGGAYAALAFGALGSRREVRVVGAGVVVLGWVLGLLAAILLLLLWGVLVLGWVLVLRVLILLLLGRIATVLLTLRWWVGSLLLRVG